MVAGAVWSDLDGDGLPELVLACEWGALKIFRNERGRLVPWDPEVTISPGSPLWSRLVPRPASLGKLSRLTGWWNGVTTGDLDGDGRLDIVAANWGLNGEDTATLERPLQLS